MSDTIVATATKYTVELHVEGAPLTLMPYSRVKGRQFRPHHIVLTYSQWFAGNAKPAQQLACSLAAYVIRAARGATT